MRDGRRRREGARASMPRSGDETPVGIQVSRLATQAAGRFLPRRWPPRPPSPRPAAGTRVRSCGRFGVAGLRGRRWTTERVSFPPTARRPTLSSTPAGGSRRSGGDPSGARRRVAPAAPWRVSRAPGNVAGCICASAPECEHPVASPVRGSHASRIGMDGPNPRFRGLFHGRDSTDEYRRDSLLRDASQATRYGWEVFRCCIASCRPDGRFCRRDHRVQLRHARAAPARRSVSGWRCFWSAHRTRALR